MARVRTPTEKDRVGASRRWGRRMMWYDESGGSGETVYVWLMVYVERKRWKKERTKKKKEE